MKYLLWLSLFANISCGLVNPKHVDYVGEEAETKPEDSTGSDTSKPASGCDAAIAAFASNIKPGIKTAGCAGSSCHAAQLIAGGKLSESDDTLNRATLNGYAKGSPDKLIKKMAGGHSGGVFTSVLTDAKINAWQTAEADCK
jgi:hypothetical protein